MNYLSASTIAYDNELPANFRHGVGRVNVLRTRRWGLELALLPWTMVEVVKVV